MEDQSVLRKMQCVVAFILISSALMLADQITLKNGDHLTGKIVKSDGKTVVLPTEFAGAGTIQLPATTKQKDTRIRHDAEQTGYYKSLHPTLLHGWTGGVNIGFSLARGNSDTENLALAFNAAHPTIHDKITLSASSVYTENSAPGASPATIANLVEGLFRYDHNINARTFVLVGTHS